MQGIAEQLDERYAKGQIAVIVSQYRIVPVRNRADIRPAKSGVELRTGKRWTFAFTHQVKFVASDRI